MDAQTNNNSNANGSITNPIVSINQLNQAFSVTRPTNSNNPKQLENDHYSPNEPTNRPETFNPSILPDATNQTFTDLSKNEAVNDVVVNDAVSDAVNTSSPTTVEHRDFEDSKNNNNKKGRKPKLVSSKSENVKSEVADSEQVTISFSILAKEKKQIEAVAILSGYDSVGEFITKLVLQGMKPYLDAVSQAFNKDKS